MRVYVFVKTYNSIVGAGGEHALIGKCRGKLSEQRVLPDYSDEVLVKPRIA